MTTAFGRGAAKTLWDVLHAITVLLLLLAPLLALAGVAFVFITRGSGEGGDGAPSESGERSTADEPTEKGEFEFGQPAPDVGEDGESVDAGESESRS